MTEADSDARSFFIIFKPPWSNLTLETVPSKSIRGYAFSFSPCLPSSRAIFPPSFSRDVLPISRGMKAPANQVNSLSLSLSLRALSARVTRVFNIDVVFTRSGKCLPSVATNNQDITRAIRPRWLYFYRR